MIGSLVSNNDKYFCGFGEHTSNNMLYMTVLYSAMPAFVLCKDNKQFDVCSIYNEKDNILIATQHFMSEQEYETIAHFKVLEEDCHTFQSKFM